MVVQHLLCRLCGCRGENVIGPQWQGISTEAEETSKCSWYCWPCRWVEMGQETVTVQDNTGCSKWLFGMFY